MKQKLILPLKKKMFKVSDYSATRQIDIKNTLRSIFTYKNIKENLSLTEEQIKNKVEQELKALYLKEFQTGGKRKTYVYWKIYKRLEKYKPLGVDNTP